MSRLILEQSATLTEEKINALDSLVQKALGLLKESSFEDVATHIRKFLVDWIGRRKNGRSGFYFGNAADDVGPNAGGPNSAFFPTDPQHAAGLVSQDTRETILLLLDFLPTFTRSPQASEKRQASSRHLRSLCKRYQNDREMLVPRCISCRAVLFGRDRLFSHSECHNCRRVDHTLDKHVEPVAATSNPNSRINEWDNLFHAGRDLLGPDLEDVEVIARIDDFLVASNARGHDGSTRRPLSELTRLLQAASQFTKGQRSKSRSCGHIDMNDLPDLVLASLRFHHKFEGDSIGDWTPVKQVKILEQLEMPKNRKGRISEVFKDLFGGYKEYRIHCHNKGILEKLRELSHEKSKASGSKHTIGGFSGTSARLREVNSNTARR